MSFELLVRSKNLVILGDGSKWAGTVPGGGSEEPEEPSDAYVNGYVLTVPVSFHSRSVKENSGSPRRWAIVNQQGGNTAASFYPSPPNLPGWRVFGTPQAFTTAVQVFVPPYTPKAVFTLVNSEDSYAENGVGGSPSTYPTYRGIFESDPLWQPGGSGNGGDGDGGGNEPPVIPPTISEEGPFETGSSDTFLGYSVRLPKLLLPQLTENDFDLAYASANRKGAKPWLEFNGDMASVTNLAIPSGAISGNVNLAKGLDATRRLFFHGYNAWRERADSALRESYHQPDLFQPMNRRPPILIVMLASPLDSAQLWDAAREMAHLRFYFPLIRILLVQPESRKTNLFPLEFLALFDSVEYVSDESRLLSVTRRFLFSPVVPAPVLSVQTARLNDAGVIVATIENKYRFPRFPLDTLSVLSPFYPVGPPHPAPSDS